MKKEDIKNGLIVKSDGGQIGVISDVRKTVFDVCFDSGEIVKYDYPHARFLETFTSDVTPYIKSLSWWLKLTLDEQQTHQYHYCTSEEIGSMEFEMSDILKIYMRVHPFSIGDEVLYDNFGKDFGSEVYEVISKDGAGYMIGNDVTKPFYAQKYQLKLNV